MPLSSLISSRFLGLSIRSVRRGALSSLLVSTLAYLAGCGVTTQNLPLTTVLDPDTDAGVVIVGVDDAARVEVRRGPVTDDEGWDCKRSSRVAWVRPVDGYVVLRLRELPQDQMYAISKLKNGRGEEFVAVEGTQVLTFAVHSGEVAYAGHIDARPAVPSVGAANPANPWGADAIADSIRIEDLSGTFVDELMESIRHDDMVRSRLSGLAEEQVDVTDGGALDGFAVWASWRPRPDAARRWIAGHYPNLPEVQPRETGSIRETHHGCRGTMASRRGGAYMLVLDSAPMYRPYFQLPPIPMR